jgi:hypothetical protein
MTTLTLEQQQFIARHGIALHQVFFAAGRRRRDYLQPMRDSDCVVAVGVTPCRNAGHSMRDVQGHCVQCNAKSLGFHRQFHNSGCVYVAFSSAKKITKVGSTCDLKSRINKLNSVGYGGAMDWELIHSAEFSDAGQIEAVIHKELKPYRVSGSYSGDSRDGDCHELFACTAQMAVQALDRM